MPDTYDTIDNQAAAGETGADAVVAAAETSASQRIVIDPIPRIEGHLRIEVKIENGRVTDAWSSGTAFRGVEAILKGRDPRDAWIFAQRMCGVCTTVHALASVRAVENALDIEVPDNARIMRNLIAGIQYVQDHVMHFYHLHALDWVDVVSSLSGDPAAAARMAQSMSQWPNNSAEYFAAVRQRLTTFVQSGQLGLFANGYWGHPAYRMPAEANLIAMSHYLEALDWQRDVIKMQAILGGKNPHPQTYLVGGMALPVNPSSDAGINAQAIASLRSLAAQALTFVTQVYLPDLLMVASFNKDYAYTGGGPGNFLSYGEFPQENGDDVSSLWLPRGVVFGQNLDARPAPVDQRLVQEFIAHSWYSYPESNGNSLGKHPSQGVTVPNYTGPQPPYQFLNTGGKYSWLKAPRYDSRVMEVGPVARMAVAYAAGHGRVRDLVDEVLASLFLQRTALFSTLGRIAARGIETQIIAEQLPAWISQLEANMNSGNLAIHNGERWEPSTWPADASGWGMTEAPRGALAHWIRIKGGKIENYQAVVATTWNGSPRDARGQHGPWERALIGTPVADPLKPVEILRAVHSFDPCMACAVHLIDLNDRELTHFDVV